MKSIDPRVAYFDELAGRWDQEEPSPQAMIAGLARRAELLALRGGQSLLEVGCGTGKTTAWLAEQVAPGRVTAIDFAPAMIARAKAKGIDADFACRDVCRDDLGREKYDVALCFHSFPHFRDPPAALRILARALRPGGRLIVMHLAGRERINSFHAQLCGAVRGDALPAEGEWPALLAEAGFQRQALVDAPDLYFLEAVRLAADA